MQPVKMKREYAGEDIKAMRDLLLSDGWKAFMLVITNERAKLVESLIKAKPAEVQDIQGQIKGLDKVRSLTSNTLSKHSYFNKEVSNA